MLGTDLAACSIWPLPVSLETRFPENLKSRLAILLKLNIIYALRKVAFRVSTAALHQAQQSVTRSKTFTVASGPKNQEQVTMDRKGWPQSL